MSIDPLPPFPDDVSTVPLTIIDYELIKQGNEEELDKLWKAATELGFWHLKNHGVDSEVDEMFQVGSETMDLPMEEKMKYHARDDGVTFGYINVGARANDEYGNLDAVEFMNVAKDDALAFPEVVHHTYPSIINACMESKIKPFVLKSVDVNNTIMTVFEKKLSLPVGALAKRHIIQEESNCEVRIIKKPPKVGLQAEEAKDKVAIGGHTDFGSLTFLHNRLGGLQVLLPGGTDWKYVTPIPGHAICNIGDALTTFSGGILRSNMHRVVQPPGSQIEHTRWSLVYFTRPGNNIRLHALSDASTIIKERVEQLPTDERAQFEMDVTALQWFSMRSKNFRARKKAEKADK